MTDSAVCIRVAVATALAAQKQGLARQSLTLHELISQTTRTIETAQAATRALMNERVIAAVPAD